jgi:hypothetical protein
VGNIFFYTASKTEVEHRVPGWGAFLEVKKLTTHVHPKLSVGICGTLPPPPYFSEDKCLIKHGDIVIFNFYILYRYVLELRTRENPVTVKSEVKFRFCMPVMVLYITQKLL